MSTQPAGQRMAGWLKHLPCMAWLPGYDRHTFSSDAVAALIVTVMLIPQSLAYAMLAGLPAEVGLYASMAPLLAYAVLGTSRVLAVGPVAITALMAATALGQWATPGSPAYLEGALVLALLSGLMLMGMAVLQLGFLANFLSNPVTSGFVSASSVLIALSQTGHLLGIRSQGDTVPAMLASLWQHAADVRPATLGLGLVACAWLLWSRSGLKPLLVRLGCSGSTATLGGRLAPVLAIAATTAWVGVLGWHQDGPHGLAVKVVGAIPQGLPPLTWPAWNPALWHTLLMPALLISVVGYVQSLSAAQTLAARQRQRVSPNAELLALGASNVVVGLTGGMPVTGSLSRSVVNADAGALTPASGAFTAVALLLASLWLTPWLFYLPQATLAATIIVAVLTVIDLDVLRRTWHCARADFAAVAATIAATLMLGVNAGLVAGVAVSLLLYLWRTSHPHMAVVGRVPGTEHFRNVLRHNVQTQPHVLGLRVDESLYFANARTLEDRINQEVAQRPALRHVVLQCTAINDIDASALESLQAIDHRLQEAGLHLHLSEVKGPVMDKLQCSGWLAHLSGQVFLTHHQAVLALEQETGR